MTTVNSGNVTLYGVDVTDAQATLGEVLTTGPVCQSLTSPAAACTGLTSTTLDPGQVARFVATYVVTQADVDAGTFADTASSAATDPGGNPVTALPSTAIVAVNPVTALSLTGSANPVDVNGDGIIDPGDRIDWTFVLTNKGTATVDTIAFTAAAGVTCLTTTLAPGASMTCTAPSHVVTDADAATGSVAITADASGLALGSLVVTSNSSTLSAVVQATPALAQTGVFDLPRLILGGLAALLLGSLLLVAIRYRRRA